MNNSTSCAYGVLGRMFMEEREIRAFPGYWIYDDGRVWSSPRGRNTPGRFLSPSIMGEGYHRYVFYRDGKQCKKLAHRLVLEAFVGPCPEGMQCRHLDGNPQNNHVSNLCWGTAKENAGDKRRHGTQVHLCGEKSGSAKLTFEEVCEIRDLALDESYSQREIAKMYETTQANVSSIKLEKSWRSHE